MVASGNDFVVVDNRKKIVKNAAALARRICALHQGAGADGLLLYENSSKADFKMRIVNLDGSEAAACGNGFRCIALYAREVMRSPAVMKFESGSGIIEGRVGARGVVKVQLIKPRVFETNGVIEVLRHRMHYAFLDTGVPHAVIFVEGLSKIDVAGIGRLIRVHEKFKPAGTNVNFVEVTGKNEIAVRTYERGVENETLACGTGSTASAVISVLKGYVKAPVAVRTTGGEKLVIDMEQEGPGIKKVFLEGKAQIVYKGDYYL
jgi:diaminopimelate epimerase